MELAVAHWLCVLRMVFTGSSWDECGNLKISWLSVDGESESESRCGRAKVTTYIFLSDDLLKSQPRIKILTCWVLRKCKLACSGSSLEVVKILHTSIPASYLNSLDMGLSDFM